jgi:hypothetical protein
MIDLPPGEVHVEAKSSVFGVSSARCVLQAGTEVTLHLPLWAPPRDVTLQLVDGNLNPLPNEEFQIAIAGQHQAATVYGTTDEMGRSVATLSGGGSAIVGTKRGFAVSELAADATALVVTFGQSGDGYLTVEVGGWWTDKVRSIGSLRSRNGCVEFVPGRVNSKSGSFRVVRGDPYVLVVMLRDRSKLFVTPTPAADVMTLESPPASQLIRVVANGIGPAPQNVMLRLESVGGIDVGGTSFTRALGSAYAFGEDVRLLQAASLTLVAEAAPLHGGLAWRSPRVTIEPGLDHEPIGLELLK